MEDNSSGSRNIVEMSHTSEDGDVLRTFGGKAGPVEEAVREAKVEVVARLDFSNVLRSQLEAKSFNIGDGNVMAFCNSVQDILVMSVSLLSRAYSVTLALVRRRGTRVARFGPAPGPNP